MDTHESAHRPVETYVKISLDFFGAMKRVTFDQCNQNDLLHFFAAALHGLPPLDKWSVNRDPYIEPDHPEWFEDGVFLVPETSYGANLRLTAV